MITTSYFAREKNIPNPVSISQVKPRWDTQAKEYKKLAPPWDLVDRYKKGLVTPAEYTEEFHRTVLSKLDPKAVLEEIIRLFGDDATLLCYEKAGDFCHRRIVADWITAGTGVAVPERKF